LLRDVPRPRDVVRALSPGSVGRGSSPVTSASKRKRVLTFFCALALGATAHADADPDLQVHHAPMPRSLRMRGAQAPAPRAAQAAAPASSDDDSVPAPIRARTERAADRGIAPTDSAAAVRFRMDLGFGVDGAQDSGNPNLAGRKLSESPYDSSRG